MDGDHYIQNKNRSGFRPWQFLAVFLGVFFLFALILFTIDFVPEAPKTSALESTTSQALTTRTQPIVQNFPIENPVRIVAPSVGIDTPIENPSSTNVEVLDSALLKGAARYPASALLGENARMYIFGHQSYLPIVHNQAFKAFNGIQKLQAGDEIIISSATAEYHYRVRSVQHVSATDAQIELGSGERTLTLSTCDSFGSKTDRYVVTADFVSRNSL